MKSFLQITGASALLLAVAANAGAPREISSNYIWDQETGNGKWETTLLSIGNKGVYESKLDSETQSASKLSLTIENFGKDQGWDSKKHIRIIDSGSMPAVIGFGNKGVYYSSKAYGADKFSEPKLVLEDLGYDQGWRKDKHIRMMTMGGIVGFANKGTYLAKTTYNFDDQGFYIGYDSPELLINDFGYDQGWRNDKHLRFMVDMDGDYQEDIVGFSNKGVQVSRSTGGYDYKTGEETPVVYAKPTTVLNDFGYNQGWRNDKHLRFIVNIDGNYRRDIVGFGNKGVYKSVLEGYDDSSSCCEAVAGELKYSPIKLIVEDFGYDQGWRNDKHIRLVMDVNGDHRPDIIGFGNKGVYVALAKCDSTFEKSTLWIEDFGADQGWTNDKHIRTLKDVNNDRLADIVAYGNAGVFVALNNGTGFDASELWLDDLGYDQGWTLESGQQVQQMGTSSSASGCSCR